MVTSYILESQYVSNTASSPSLSSSSPSMQNSSVLIVHPSDYRFPMAAGNPAGKFGGRHYSLDSPGSLTSPPAYDMPLMPGAEQKPGVAAALSMQNSCGAPGGQMSSCSPPFSQINPLVYSHPGHAGLLPLSKWSLIKIVIIALSGFSFFSPPQILLLQQQYMPLTVMQECTSIILLLDQWYPRLCPLDALSRTGKESKDAIGQISQATSWKSLRKLLKRHAIQTYSCVKSWP